MLNENEYSNENGNVNGSSQTTGQEGTQMTGQTPAQETTQSAAQTAGQTGQTGAQTSGTENRTPSDSLYSYSYVKNGTQTDTQNNAQNNTYQNTTYNGAQNSYYQNSQSSASNGGQGSYYGSNGSVNGGTTQNSYYQGNTYQNYSAGSGSKPAPKKEKKKSGFGRKLARCAAIALVFGLVSGSVFYGTGTIFNYAFGKNKTTSSSKSSGTTQKVTTTGTTTTAVASDVSDVVEEVMPAIVSITSMTVQQQQTWFGQNVSQESSSAGSGIIVAQTDDTLYIATNNHVVEDSTSLSVTFCDDESVAAEIKGTDSSTDLAVLEIALDDIPEDTLSEIKVATLGDSDSLKMGEPAIAIGNALGYGQSVTTGVISALNREVTMTDSDNNTITNSLIQTSAAINPGNSGGALLNINGEVIGINEVKYSDTSVEGMGFAIPIATAEPIINDLITRETVSESEAAFLGVYGQDVTETTAQKYNMPEGIYVAKVTSGSAAEQYGIQLGDIITSFDGRSVETMDALKERITYYKAGTTVDVVVQRMENGEWTEKTLSVTLGKKN